MGRLFSYVVDHDYGISPNPAGGFCTLAFCKFSRTGARPNVVELAQKGDWVIGTGGVSRFSVGRGKLVYAMRIGENLPLSEFLKRFVGRDGNDHDLSRLRQRRALVSDHFFYFGSSAPELAPQHLARPIEKRGQGFRNRFEADFIADFERWLLNVAGSMPPLARGIYGLPAAASDARWVEKFTPPVRKTPRRVCRPTC